MWWLALSTQLIATNQPDSLEVLRTARLAQARFEDYRVDHLPWSRGGNRGGRCDEVVGRFCFWHDDDDDSWTPIPEPPQIQAARLELLRTLDRLQGLMPGDPWITGQRVRYLIEAQRTGEAVAGARACRSAAWWCHALAGYALHASREYAAADSAFGAALAAMPAEQRCRWTDLSLVLNGLRGRYHKLSCTQRDVLDRRIWWLADPLYLVPGNERRTEHFSRRMINTLQDGARSAYVHRWGSDLEELVLRYGWPVAWERDVPASGNAPLPRTIAHNQRNSRQFLPPARFVEAPNTILANDWDLDPEHPVSAYAPAYAAAFDHLPHQLAVFRRGDSIVVVAGYDARTVPVERGPAQRGAARPARRQTPVDAALVLANDEHAEPVMVRAVNDEPVGVLAAIAPARSALVSLETLKGADSAHASRVRYWLAVSPPGRDVAVSDPLMLRVSGEDSLPRSLPDALPLVRPAARARRGERVGVFWETYGLEHSSAPFRVTLAVTRQGRSWIRKAAEWAGLAGRDTRYVSLSWEEPARPGTPVYPRALALSLPDASPGLYLLELEVAVPGRPVARSRRDITIEP